MTPKRKYKHRQPKKIFTCRHCKTEFEGYNHLTIEYCSKECNSIYNPIFEKKKKTREQHALKPFYKAVKNVLVAEIQDMKGIHEDKLRQGITDTLLPCEISIIKEELKASYLNTVQELQGTVNHLSDKQIDKNVDELFAFMQSICFINPSSQVL